MCATSVTLSSMNCQGLGDMKKRRDVFHYLRNKNYSIYLLQDTHFDSELEQYVKSEWGYTCHFASYNSSSRGVAVLFNNNFEFSVTNVQTDVNGNYIFVSVKMFDKEVVIVNLYGPNQDVPQFYVDLEKRLKEMGCNNIIVCGDWNLVMNFSLDYCNYKHNNNVKSQEQVESMMFTLDLVDIWRELNPDLRRYTWRRNRPFQQSRLDFFTISDALCPYVIDADILPGYRTDHSLVVLSLSMGPEEKRFTLWKFNSSLLKDREYLKEVNDIIKDVTDEYAALPYDRSNISDVGGLDLQLTISDQLFLDTLLMKIRAKTMTYGSKKKKESQKQEKDLEKKIGDLEKQTNLQESETLELENYKKELVSIRERRMEGVLLRSRARWIAEGEKVTKYFCSLEKRNYVSKQIRKLTRSNGDVLTDLDAISQEVNHFYRILYTERPVEFFPTADFVNDIPTLNANERESLEGEITLEEAGWALKNMSHNKSPGSDGFTAEFLKVFWNKLGSFVVRSLNEGFHKGELSTTQKEGVIICIPKGDKSRDLIKNWRPISLLNVVYKIGSACIANRLKVVLPSIISEDQSGFIKDRYLGDNVRIIYDLIEYLNKNKKPGLLLCLDFEKAFDSLNWGYMFKVLTLFGFGENFTKWIYTFYHNIKASVTVNGALTPWFSIQRGCRQGDPLSPYLFVICVEILAIMIKRNDKIKGIFVNEIESKILQYADDTELTLEGDKESFHEAMDTINTFGKMSGLILNTDKSNAVWLGSKRNSVVKYMPHLEMTWNPERFKILGIWFTCDLKECVKINFDEKFLEVKSLYRIWLKRQLTPLGRVAVLKSLILSKLVHLWLLLPNPPDNIINAIQKTIFQFVWNSKNDRISRKVSVKNVNDGGIGIPDVRKYMNALKLTWIRKLCSRNVKWKYFLTGTEPLILLLDKLGSAINSFVNVNVFWTDVFDAYFEVGRKTIVVNIDELASEPFFCNDKILIARAPFLSRNWIQKGVYIIGNLLDENGQFLKYQAFKDKYGIETNFLLYNGCVQSIKKYLVECNLNTNEEICTSWDKNKTLRMICSVNKGARLLYDALIKDDNVPNCCAKWEVKISTDIVWKCVFSKIARIKDVKLKWLQIRIVHRIVGTNVMLQSMGLNDSTTCSFCHTYKENIQHIFWHCDFVRQFWISLQTLLNNSCNHFCNFSLSEQVVIFGCSKNFRSDEAFDLILLLAKSYIYLCKMKKEKPILDSFLRILKSRFEIEKHNSKLRMQYTQFRTLWNMYDAVINL